MDLQAIFVGIIITFAAAYFGFILWRKGSSFSVKEKNCDTDCGCD